MTYTNHREYLIATEKSVFQIFFKRTPRNVLASVLTASGRAILLERIYAELSPFEILVATSAFIFCRLRLLSGQVMESAFPLYGDNRSFPAS